MRYLPLLLLAGCQLVPIDMENPPPADWPKLSERINYVALDQLERLCRQPRPVGVEGCTVISFEAMTCNIYLASKDAALLEHERWHCRGYPHVRESKPSKYTQAWEAWKAK